MVGFDLDPQLSLALRTGQCHPDHSQSSTESTSSSEVLQATDNTREEICTAKGKVNEKRSTITLFYDGRMCTSTVTEIQARAIISMAKREMEKGIRTKQNNPITTENPQKFLANTKMNINYFPAADQPQFLPNSSHQMMMLNQGLSMKHSLQRFLQKRKTRVANSASPYSRPPIAAARNTTLIN